MRFAGMAFDGGNYINAGMNSSAAIEGVLAKNTPDYGTVSNTAGAAKSQQKIASINSQAAVNNAGINSLAETRAGAFNAQATIAQGKAAAEASRAQGMSNMFSGLAGGFSSLGAKSAKPTTYGAGDFDLNKSFW